jgi:hypothetical protein
MRHVRSSALCLLGSLGLLACSGRLEEEETPGEAAQALVDSAAVLGFENPAYWAVSSGTKSASGVATQGASALGVSGFWYTELTSLPLSNLSGVSSTMSFDLRPAADLSWGLAQLYVDAPSRGVYMTYAGQVDLAGSVGGGYRTVTFNLPARVVRALGGGSYRDLRFKIAINAPRSESPHTFDNLHFGPGTAESRVTLAVTGVDDFLYVTVDGVRRKVFPVGPDATLDVSAWFASGNNTVRVQAENTGGPASYAVQLRVDEQLVIDETCSLAPCESDVAPGSGIVFDHTYDVATPHRPPASTVTIDGTADGQLYLDGAFTGHRLPASLTLPQGSYTVGVGVGEGTQGAYAGHYFEQSVSVGSSPITVTPTSGAALTQPNHTRLAILPIRTTFHGDETPQNTGVLRDLDVVVMTSQTIATRDGLLEPFSYDLTTWDVELLPTVEDVPLHRGAGPGEVPDTDRFLSEAGLTSLYGRYDSVIFFYSRFAATGDGVANGPCCFWGGGQQIIFMNQMTRGGWPDDFQNYYLLHEALHDYESFNDGRLHFYNGADGLHGGEEHGYHGGDNGEADFLQWQRRYIRNQVAELDSMRSGVDFASPPPESGDLWVGVFDAMRRGVDWSQQSLRAASLPTFAHRAPVLRGTPAPRTP